MRQDGPPENWIFTEIQSLNVTGDAFVDNFTFDIGYLNTSFSVTDTVHMTPTSIYFNDASLLRSERETR